MIRPIALLQDRAYRVASIGHRLTASSLTSRPACHRTLAPRIAKVRPEAGTSQVAPSMLSMWEPPDTIGSTIMPSNQMTNMASDLEYIDLLLDSATSGRSHGKRSFSGARQ